MTDLNVTQSDIANAVKTSFLQDKKHSFWRHLAKKLFPGYKIKDENNGYVFSLFDMLP